MADNNYNPYAGSLLLNADGSRKPTPPAMQAIMSGQGLVNMNRSPIHWQKNNPAEMFPQANKSAALPPPGAPPAPPAEPSRQPIPTAFKPPADDATNRQHGPGNPEILKQYGVGYMQDGGNTTILGHNGDMMRLDQRGNQMGAPSGGALSVLPSQPDYHAPQSALPDLPARPSAPNYNSIYDKLGSNFLPFSKEREAAAMDIYKHQMEAQIHQGATDAQNYGHQTSALGQMYGADQSARSQMYGHDQDLRGKMYGADQGLAAKMAEVQANGPLNMSQINAHNAQANLWNAQATSLPEERKMTREQNMRNRWMDNAMKYGNGDADKTAQLYQTAQDTEEMGNKGMRFVPGVEEAKKTGLWGFGKPALPKTPGAYMPKEQAERQPDRATAERYLERYKDPVQARNAWLLGVQAP